MKKLKTPFIAMSLLTGVQAAHETYFVKPGDILSRVSKSLYPAERIYGPKGSLVKLIKNNPQIRNPHKLFPNQKIFFDGTQIDSASETSKSSVPEMITREVSESKNIEEWNFFALYGAKYLSVSQSGSLGSAEIGVLFLDSIKVGSEFSLEKWSLGFQFDSYEFKYKTLTNGDSAQMHRLRLHGAYDWFFGGLDAEETPLFRNNNGNIEFTKMTLISLMAGLKKDIELPTRKPTVMNLKGWFSYPIASSSDIADVKLSDVQGYSLNGQFGLSRLILAKPEYSLHAAWMTEASILKVKQNVVWDTSFGTATSNLVTASTSIGVLFKF
jgi:hypothetical protein